MGFLANEDGFDSAAPAAASGFQKPSPHFLLMDAECECVATGVLFHASSSSSSAIRSVGSGGREMPLIESAFAAEVGEAPSPILFSAITVGFRQSVSNMT